MEWDGPGGRYFLALHPEVYRPAEDTFLLARAVHQALRPGQAFLEVGCGAGLVSLVAARAGAQVTATDLNPHAVELLQHNARQNGLRVRAIQTDLLGGVAGPFDVVAFNPPYLPTTPQEYIPGPLNLAFDGGPDGNATVLRFAHQVAALRPPPATVLVVHSSLSDPAPLERALAAAGYRCTVALQEAHFFERLTVRAFTR
ncbi:MAG: release factor glutamine methyltransferase [Thermoplasmata archaeon]|jgi:release factor glutamine methyltransferase|nr:release factor glutamine methyltransferase [Thermoplasmata archaeon]